MKQDADYQLRLWWIDELKAITARVMKEEEKRQAKERTKLEKRLGEYRTYADAQDAYGCGVINEKQFDRIVDLLEKLRPAESDLYRMKMDLLSELYQEQKKILEDRERWEATRQ
ncbi:MAG: hypothetical protein IIV93_07885 [Clostridia bacterium]|nr:hypothetical protein [Clostridia bacterium]